MGVFTCWEDDKIRGEKKERVLAQALFNFCSVSKLLGTCGFEWDFLIIKIKILLLLFNICFVKV